MYFGIGVFWIIGIPFGSMLTFGFHIGPIGLPIGMLVAIVLGTILLIMRFEHKNKDLFISK